MSTFVTSKGTRGQHVSPRYESQPYRQHPGRREHIHRRVQGANDNRRSRLWFWTQFAIMAACTAYALSLWVIR